jgi:uncharacterized membrane protein YbaN (DUF454 family)
MRTLSVVLLCLGFAFLVLAFQGPDFLLPGVFIAFALFIWSAWCWDRADKYEGKTH